MPVEVFSCSDLDLGYNNFVKHSITLTKEKSIEQCHQRISPSMYHEVRERLQSMLDAGIIRESKSFWASPTVLVRKTDQHLSIILCLNYRALNSKTVGDAYYLPR